MQSFETQSPEFRKRGYVLIEDFLSREVANLAYRYALLRLELGHCKTDPGDPQYGERNAYGDPLTESLLEQVRPAVEAVTGKALWPTYSYFRIYEKGMELTPHRDRPACEFSVSVCLGRDRSNLPDDAPDWPLFADGTPLASAPGSGVIYRGCEVEHWREPLDANHHAQMFLHYIDRAGKWGEICKFDCRPRLGVPARFQHPEKLKQLQQLLEESS